MKKQTNKEIYVTAKKELWVLDIAWSSPLAILELKERLAEKGLPTMTRALNQRKISNSVFFEFFKQGRVDVTSEQLEAATPAKVLENLELALKFIEPILARKARKEKSEPILELGPQLKPLVEKQKTDDIIGSGKPEGFMFSEVTPITKQWQDVFDNFVIPSKRPENKNQKYY